MAFYAFYSYLNSNFELAPGYFNPALLIGLPGIRVGQYLFSDLVLKNDAGQFTQWWGVGGGGRGATQQSLIRRGSAPRSNSFTSFVYLLLVNGTLFTFLVKNATFLLTDVNAPSFNFEFMANLPWLQRSVLKIPKMK